MTTPDVNPLSQSLLDARRSSEHLIRGVPLDLVVNPQSGRRVKDELAHIACWEAEVARSIEASLDGREHVLPTPFVIDEINERFFIAMRDATNEAVLQRWRDERDRFVRVVERAGQVEPPSEVMCPWGRPATVAHLVDDMIGHEQTHVHRIVEVWHRVRSSTGG